MVRNTQLESMAVAQTAAGRMVVAGVKPAAKICRRIKADVKQFLAEEDGMGVVEIVLIIIGIFTPYYGVGIRCMA